MLLQPSHWQIGCHQIARTYGRIIEEIPGASVSFMVVPHHDLAHHHRWHWYADAKIAKKSYDHAFAFESAPPVVWKEAFGSITWVPMVEFTTKQHVLELDPDVQTIWHCREGMDQASKLRPELQQRFLTFGLPGDTPPPGPRTGKPRIFLHQRARCVDCTALARYLVAHADVDVTIWDNLHRQSSIEIDGVRVISGWMAREVWMEEVGKHDLYLATRAHEGVGLCIIEAAMMGCAIISPTSPTACEYFPSGRFSVPMIPTKVHGIDHLCQRYEWPEIPRIGEQILELVATRGGLDVERERCWEMARDHDRAFRTMTKDYVSRLEPRPSKVHPKSRRRILSIQTCRWGGQGLQELWTLREMSRSHHLSVFSSCLWTQPYDKNEQEEHTRLLADSGIMMVDPRSLGTVDPDVIVLHWSSWFEKRCDVDDLAALQDFLANCHAPVIVVAHNVDPGGWPAWLQPNLRVHPTQEAMAAYKDDVPSVVVPHFFDPELATTTKDTKQSREFVLGIVGRTVWTKLDPYYIDVLAAFKKRWNARLLWLGGQSADDIRGDQETMQKLAPIDMVSSFGPERFKYMDEMNICLHLSGVQESFGLGPIEAVVRGIPVITNRHEIYNRMPEASILVGGSEDLRKVLDNLTCSQDLIRRLQEGCRIVASRAMRWERWIEEFWKHVSSISHEWKGQRARWTVIVLAKDVEKYLAQCLDSVVANDPEKIIIVVDGGFDRSADIATEYASRDSRIEVLRYPGHGHCQAWAWARAIEHCRGGLVAFVDGDDYLVPGALMKVGRVYAEDPSLSMVWTDHHVLDARDQIVDISFSSDPGTRTLLEAVEDGEDGSSHLITARHAALQLIALDETLPATADKDLCFKLEEVGPVRRLNEKLYVYRWKRPGSVTLMKPELQEACEERVIRSARDRRLRRPMPRMDAQGRQQELLGPI